MSGAAGEELSSGGKRSSSLLRVFVDRDEARGLPVLFFFVLAPSLCVLRGRSPLDDAPVAFNATMVPEYIGLSAVGWHVMVENWWDLVCIYEAFAVEYGVDLSVTL